MRSLVEDALQGVVDGLSGPTAVGLDVGGNGVEALVMITGFLSAGFFVSEEPLASGG